MRTGEVCALTWDDIDLKNRTISINHNVYCKDNDVNGRWYFGTPKTINGIRTVHINSILLKVLTNYKINRIVIRRNMAVVIKYII